MMLLVVLRLLIVLKWLLQTIGIILPLLVFSTSPLRNDDEVIAILALPFLIFPEIVMGCVLWIGKGVSSVSKMRISEEIYSMSVPVFGKTVLVMSFCFYVAILTSLALVFGELLEVPILLPGLTLFICYFWRRKMKNMFDNYLAINV